MALSRMLVDPRRPMWDTGKPAIVRMAFDYEGKRYDVGDVFPWKDLGCAEKLLQTLWQQRRFDWGSIPPELLPPGKRVATEPQQPPRKHAR